MFGQSCATLFLMTYTSKWNGRKGRPKTKAVARAISAIGEAAQIVVNEGGKFASGHDLRRSYGQRMADNGVSPRDLQKLMRHASFTTTEAYYLNDQVEDISSRVFQRCTQQKLRTVVREARPISKVV